jgi:hypothetical protein
MYTHTPNLIKKLSSVIATLLAITFLTGCTKKEPDFYPPPEPKPVIQTIEKTASSEDRVFRSATNEAWQSCVDQHRKMKMLNYEIRYQGMHKKQKQLVGLAHEIVDAYGNAESDYDYKIIMHYVCIKYTEV